MFKVYIYISLWLFEKYVIFIALKIIRLQYKISIIKSNDKWSMISQKFKPNRL